MTKPKSWPYIANRARHRALRSAKEIDELGRQAKEALDRRNHHLAKEAIQEMRIQALKIAVALRAVETTENGCQDCPMINDDEVRGKVITMKAKNVVEALKR